MRANWTLYSRKIQWNGIFGKDCCIPTIAYQLELEVEDDCPDDIADILVDFSLANEGDGKVEKSDGTLTIDMEKDSNEVEKLVGRLARPVRWALSSLLASGKKVRMTCEPLSN